MVQRNIDGEFGRCFITPLRSSDDVFKRISLCHDGEAPVKDGLLAAFGKHPHTQSLTHSLGGNITPCSPSTCLPELGFLVDFDRFRLAARRRIQIVFARCKMVHTGSIGYATPRGPLSLAFVNSWKTVLIHVGSGQALSSSIYPDTSPRFGQRTRRRNN